MPGTGALHRPPGPPSKSFEVVKANKRGIRGSLPGKYASKTAQNHVMVGSAAEFKTGVRLGSLQRVLSLDL
jgi:hypothetical protein